MSETKERTFMDECLLGEAFIQEIDDYIDKWHDSESDLPIFSFLGMTEEEYGLWVENDAFLKEIIFARKNGINISELISGGKGAYKFAARAPSQEEAENIEGWLKRTGRI